MGSRDAAATHLAGEPGIDHHLQNPVLASHRFPPGSVDSRVTMPLQQNMRHAILQRSPEHGDGKVVHQEAQAPVFAGHGNVNAAGHDTHHSFLATLSQQPRQATTGACQKMKNPDAAGCRSAPCSATAI